ncbi:HNH endonuclease signature motif containing protein [Micrococcus terreus]|uniref:HNH endonuclease signature motif containing protein n=1 Tax=Micrococcus terreus TaxID=574650 RepID=UPI003D747025
MAVTVDEANAGGTGQAGAVRSASPGLVAVQPAAPVSCASAVPVDTSGLGLGELIELAQTVAQDLAGRLCAAELTEQLAPVTEDSSTGSASLAEGSACGASLSAPAGTTLSTAGGPTAGLASGPWPVTLAQVQSGVGRLARVVELAQTAVAGVTDRVLQDPKARHRLLGLPQGKTRFRNAAEFLEKTQQTPRRDTHQRVDRAAHHLTPPPGETPDGTAVPASLPQVTGALRDTSLDPAVVDAITRTLTSARAAGVRAGADRALVDRLITQGQARLMGQARGAAPSAVSRACARWRTEFDQLITESGARATQAVVHQGRSAKYVREENGLFLWQLWLTQAQHEIIQTVTSAGTNPRAPKNRSRAGSQASGPGRPVSTEDTGQGLFDLAAPTGAGGQAGQGAEGEGDPVDAGFFHPGMLRAEERQRQQVDAIIAALGAALQMTEAGALSNTGGARPQVMVHIDYQTLTGELAAHPNLPPPPPIPEHLADQHPPGVLRGPVISAGTFTGPIDPRVIRAWACDADLIPVVLGGAGEVLDIGRAQRPFPPGIRKAIIARDHGCAAPGCWSPAAWCQIHHIRFWKKHEGPTSVENGVLLCSHHHQALHHDQITIQMTNGIPRVQDTNTSQQAQEHQPVPARNLHWHDQ